MNNQPKESGDLAVSAHYLRVMARELGAKGKQLNQLLIGTGISLEHFVNDDFKLTYEQQIIFTQNAIALIGEEDFGLRVGRRFTPETHGPIGFLVCSSPNVKAALSNFKRFVGLIFPFINLQIHNRGEKLVIQLENTQPSGDPRLDRPCLECPILTVYAIINSVLGRKLYEAEVSFTYPPPSYADRYKDYFPFPVFFSRSENTLVIDQQVALAQNPIASKANYSLALEQCSTLIEKLPTRGKSLTERAKHILLSAPPGTIDEETAAELLFMSKRTLSRQLAREGTSFRKLRTEILADIATQHLVNTSETVESIAVLLNYFDASNFRRAFKKWYNLTPEDYRLKYQEKN